MQSSVAVSADGERWILLNASPDLRQQVAAHRALWPRAPRTSPLSAVVLTDGEMDHTIGLLLLRESAVRLPLYASPDVLALLDESWPVIPVLAAYAGLEPRPLREGGAVSLADGAGRSLGISCISIPVARRPPRYVRQIGPGTFDVALRLRDELTGGTLAYIPTTAAVDDRVRAASSGADLLLFDGTFWADDELRAAGVEAATALDMGHLPVGGPGGSLAILAGLRARRTVLMHINNTNPILCRSSAERAEVEAAGIEVGEDGMEFEL